MSLKFNEAAPTRTRTSPGPGSGTSTSVTARTSPGLPFARDLQGLHRRHRFPPEVLLADT